MSARPPPLARRILASARRALPPASADHRPGSTCASSWANPSGARTSSANSRRCMLRWLTSQLSGMRTTSAPASVSSPDCTVPHRVTPVAEAIQVAPCSAHRRGQAAAGEASHRSCQLVPGKPASQVRIARPPSAGTSRCWRRPGGTAASAAWRGFPVRACTSSATASRPRGRETGRGPVPMARLRPGAPAAARRGQRPPRRSDAGDGPSPGSSEQVGEGLGPVSGGGHRREPGQPFLATMVRPYGLDDFVAASWHVDLGGRQMSVA